MLAKTKQVLHNFVKILRANDELLEDTQSKYRLMFITSTILMIAAIITSVFNVLEKDFSMLACSVALSVTFFIINILIYLKTPKKYIGYLTCFILCLIFSVSIILGGNEGFAMNWILLIPPAASMLLGIKLGLCMGGYFFVFICVYFYAPISRLLLYTYPQTVSRHFPVLYTCCLIVTMIIQVQLKSLRIRQLDYAEELKQSMLAVEYKDILLNMANEVSKIFLTTNNEDGFERSLREGMSLIARCLKVDRIYIWQNKIKDGSLQYVQQFGWINGSERKEEIVRSGTGFFYDESFPEWEEIFLKGECINKSLKSLPESERRRMEPFGIESFLVVPVRLQDRLWGFVSFDDCRKERLFTEEEIGILRSLSLTMARVMDRHETDVRMREADELSKLMLDATPLCCSLWDSDFNLIDCNEESVNFYGLKDKREYLDRFFELLPERQPDGTLTSEKLRKYIADAFREGKIVFEWMHQTLDGVPAPKEVTLTRVRKGDKFIVASYTRDLREYKKITTENEYKSRLLRAVNGAAEFLLTADDNGFENSLRDAMALMARCMDVDRIYIWQNKMRDGLLQYIQKFEWLGNREPSKKNVLNKTGFSYAESIPEWEEIFLKGECVNGPLRSLSHTEQKRLAPYGIKSILVIPVYLQDFFWGFVSFDDCRLERTFTGDEVSILRSASLMMASAVERHETAVKMRETDEYIKLMLDATPLCCSLWDKNLNIINCNAEVVNFYGLENKQEYLDKFFDLSPEYQPDGSLSSEKASEYLAAAFRDGGSVLEWMHQMPDGEPVPVELTLVRVRRGEEFIVAGYTRDLREHKKMMKEIAYKDNLLQTVNEVAGILLRAETDEFELNLLRCMGMIAASVEADRMYIWKNHEKDGQIYSTQLYEWSEKVEPQQGGKYTVDIPLSSVSGWEKKLQSGQCVNDLVSSLTAEEQTYLNPQGVLSILAVPVFLRDYFWGFVGFDDCFRERIFSEEEVSILRSGSLLIANALLRNEMTHEIKAAVEQAQSASKSKSAFLAHMSHEIRTPMNVISGMTELILREDIPKTIYEYIMSVKHSSANMLSLINDILDFSKIEAGSLEIASAEYLLTSLINDVLIIIRMKVSEKPIIFTANIDCNIPNRLIGDDMRVRQILLNVLDNAAKYTNEGFVSLAVNGKIEGDTIILTAEVSDSGIGIRKENAEKLFDDFMRFDGDRNKSVQGTGLGLAITRSLCKAMGGNISVQSEYGSGSTFTITIPQKIKSHDEKFARVSEPDIKQVLLYEIRPLYADSIVRSLDNLGVRSVLVKNETELHEELMRFSYPYVFVSSLLSESVWLKIKELNMETTLVLLTEFGEAPAMRGVRTIAMPVHAATIANILDDIENNIFYIESGWKNVRFIAPSAKILVVDDLNTNLKVTQGLMLPYQMQVDICESGEEAIEYVQKKRYDIIFMDHMMPGIDGIEAARRIRSIEDEGDYYGNVPIIALTANAVSGVKEMFLQNGMNDFLAKPIDVNKLHGLLEKWIPDDKKEKSKKTKERSSADIKPAQIQIDGVDVQGGIAMSGGTVDNYLKTLAIFHLDGSDRINKIRDCVDKNDIKLYTIYVHALKSAAATIGAWEISELFKTLEMAGARKDVEFVRDNTERLLKELDMLLKNIQAVISKNQDEPSKENDPEFLRKELLRLKEALNNRDAGEIDDIMNTLEAVKWDRQSDGLFKEISKNILLINYSDAIILIDKLLIK